MIPEGFCQCGCGGRVSLAPQTRTDLGWVRGRPVNYITGHHALRHGHSTRAGVSAEYTAWQGMKDRCFNSKQKDYHRYGGRGIKVCKRWLNSFENFLADVGPRPLGTTLDRFPNRNGDYEPGNVRWATRLEQSRNRDCLHMLEVDGRQLCLSEVARSHGMTKRQLGYRLSRGWQLERALIQPIMKKRRRTTL